MRTPEVERKRRPQVPRPPESHPRRPTGARSTFVQGASIPDPRRLFNSSLEGNTRRQLTSTKASRWMRARSKRSWRPRRRTTTDRRRSGRYEKRSDRRGLRVGKGRQFRRPVVERPAHDARLRMPVAGQQEMADLVSEHKSENPVRQHLVFPATTNDPVDEDVDAPGPSRCGTQDRLPHLAMVPEEPVRQIVWQHFDHQVESLSVPRHIGAIGPHERHADPGVQPRGPLLRQLEGLEGRWQRGDAVVDLDNHVPCLLRARGDDGGDEGQKHRTQAPGGVECGDDSHRRRQTAGTDGAGSFGYPQEPLKKS